MNFTKGTCWVLYLGRNQPLQQYRPCEGPGSPGGPQVKHEPAVLAYKETLREMDLFSVGKRRLRGDLVNAYKYLKGGCQDHGAGLALMEPSNRTRSRGCKLQHRKLPLKVRKNFFLVRVTVLELSRELVESPSQEFLKTHLDVILGNML